MKIVSINNPIVKKPEMLKSQSNVLSLKNSTDSIELSKQSKIGVFSEGKNLHVSFTGNFQNPIETGVQFKISGVTKHQKGSPAANANATDDNLVKLAASNWKDGQELNYTIDDLYGGSITLIDKKYGEIGNVPASVAKPFIELINKDKANFKFELTNVTGGVTSDFPIIAAKANLKYVGENKELKSQVQAGINELINSSDKQISSSVSIYQPKFSPSEVLSKIFDVEGQRNGLGEVRKIKDAIDTITKEINNPNNKNILVVGHCSPDGDTIGSVLGMTAALKGAYPDRNVDSAIDDDIPNSFGNLPGVKDIKRPFNSYAVNSVKKNIEMLERNESSAAKAQIELLNKELEKLTDASKLFDPETAKGGKSKKYDLVIMLDTPIPGRTSRAFKPYFENASKTIFIDHHPHKPAEWQDAVSKVGFDMAKTCQEKLALVVDSVPAATQLVTVIAEKAGMLGKMFANSAENAKKYVAGIIAGTQTDTANYNNAASYSPSEAKMAKTEKANYYPEGMSNWLIDKLDGNIDKKWIRENLFYELPNNPLTNNLGPRDAVLKTALKNREMHSEIGLGIMKASYDLMENVLKEAQKQDKNVTMTDVYNAYKNSEVMGALKADPKFMKKNEKPQTLSEMAAETYRSDYDDDRVAVFMAQNQKEGTINKFSQIADKNTISFSFRSGGKSNAAQVLATLFGGGGHAAAAGGSISMKGLTFNSKLKVKIDGNVVDDAKTIYEAASNNARVSNDNKIPFGQKSKMIKKIDIEMTQDDKGRTCSELITDVTAELRKTQKGKQEAYSRPSKIA